MAFHFQPQADSSDEDEQVDLSSWKTGAKTNNAPSPPQAALDVMQELEAGSDREVDTNALAAFTAGANALAETSEDDGAKKEGEEEQVADEGIEASDAVDVTTSREGSSMHKRKRTSVTEDVFVSPSFTPVNSRAPVPPPDSEGELSTTKLPPPKQKSGPSNSAGRRMRSVIPMIPRVRLHSDEEAEIEDFTAGGDVVRKVKKELGRRGGKTVYLVEFEDRHIEEIRLEELHRYENGRAAFNAFQLQLIPASSPEPAQRASRMTSTRPGRRAAQRDGMVSTIDAIDVSGDEVVSEDEIGESRKRGRKRKQVQSQYIDQAESESESDEPDGSDDGRKPRLRLRLRNNKAENRNLRSARHPVYSKELSDEDEEDDSGSLPFLDSDLPGAKRRRTKLRGRGPGRRTYIEDDIGFDERPMRQSGRATRHQGGMQEVGENKIYRSDSDKDMRGAPKPTKVVGAREQFKPLPRNDEFRMRHIQECESCGQGANFAQLVYCQGCTLAYHKSCLGPRNSREHLVSKIAEGDSVLQCRRCVAYAKKKEPTAPDQGKCGEQSCREHGNACQPFRPRKTVAQEQKEREDNDGEDPTYEIDASRVNQADNVLFRCLTCWRAFHFEHLPSRSDVMDMDIEVDVEQRFREYRRDWKCKECLDMPARVSGIIAWKPMDEDNYDPGIPFENVDEDEKNYLVRWTGMSYFRAAWMPGAWVWGVTGHSMRKAFAKREDSHHPKMRTEDAIPEDFLRTDIVLDIKYTSIVEIRTEEIDKARIREVDKALIKYKGLGYEDAVWEAPPSPEDGERWTDFLFAYNEWVQGRYIRIPKSQLKARLDRARGQDFAKLEKKTQPDNIEGGELMKYQIEGLNWLYYKWFTQKNAILADEMGLGKTIQIIGFLATLVHDWNCFPFLIVVPNSTCPNWRREIKRWAPSLRVVAYYGSKESRDLAYRYELFPEGSKDLRCHIVVTSYDAASDDNCKRFFRSVTWQGLIVDEGQRLKNDKNLLYTALGQLKTPFRILLTGTPLQNNARELFNLLHFLDDTYDAAQLEQEYSELDSNKIIELHNTIRPFFLRRTKAQVLTFLPPMAQIILPVSMTLVQKKLYRTILAKNPDLIKAIFSSETPLKQAERGSLSNILMQLRKCLCHPFVYNKSIEERNVTYAMSHRNLVDASSKLKLLELLLPKLKERGHRVLIFSQFLDMLDIVEDVLDGMELKYQRLDGSISALQKQKRIDEFNAPDSPLFCFLLSTRAGGIGINLASADTVIILDPDFNPHQDIQALSRAHRIGQSKKVLCFQLVTRASAEERIMQMGRKKLALDHVLIQEMDADDADQNDLVSVLRHGASELFSDSGDQDINYDPVSVERLLDRSNIEDAQAGEDKSAETQFSFARVWANNQGTLQDEMIDEREEQQAPDPGVWANILKERERIAADDAAAKADAYGRGRRTRGNVDYNNGQAPDGVEGLDITPVKKKVTTGDESDTDFQVDGSDPEDEEPDGELDNEVEKDNVGVGSEGAKRVLGPKKLAPPTFKRAHIPQTKYHLNGYPTPPDMTNVVTIDRGIFCMACRSFHPQGSCPLKLGGIEFCNLCGMAHFGSARVCPHIQSETQVRQMVEALKSSNEPEHLVAEAKRYLRGLKGNLVQVKKLKEAKVHAAREAHFEQQYERHRGPLWQV